MKVILKDDVEGLGSIGHMVNVSDGYARNYLIPKNLAVEANPRNLKKFEHEKRQIMAKAERVKRSAEDMAKRLSDIRLELMVKAGEEGKLFGSITTMDIADALSKEGIDIDRRRISIDDPIKRLGTYDVSIRLHPDVDVKLSIEVKPEIQDSNA
jgi:large subunit ribosomal protein L9